MMQSLGADMADHKISHVTLNAHCHLLQIVNAACPWSRNRPRESRNRGSRLAAALQSREIVVAAGMLGNNFYLVNHFLIIWWLPGFLDSEARLPGGYRDFSTPVAGFCEGHVFVGSQLAKHAAAAVLLICHAVC